MGPALGDLKKNKLPSPFSEALIRKDPGWTKIIPVTTLNKSTYQFFSEVI